MHRFRWPALRGAFAVVAVGILTSIPASARAQTPWTATLFVTPYPSPYLSDWETNPTIASLTVVNGGSATQDVILRYQVTNQAGAVVTTGRSDPQSVPPSAPAVYTDLTEIAGSQEYDPTLEDQVRRSGRMPEGGYTACVAVTDLGGFVLTQACADFTIVYPDPPMLVAPANGDVVTSAAPIFQWTPLQLPPDFSLQYVLQVAEVLPGQVPEAALSSNILHYENLDVGTTNLAYPVDALPLESGKTYAWRVVAMDQNGYAAATNGGSSEIWTFAYRDASDVGTTSAVLAPSTLQVQIVKAAQDSAEHAGARLNAAMNALCATSDQWASGAVDSVLTLSVLAPFFQPDTLGVSVYFAVDSNSVLGPTQQWAITGASSTHNWEYFARGDCEGPSDSTGLVGAMARLHWIAVRPKTYRFSDYLAQAFNWDRADTTADHQGIELSFGTAILSLRSTTVGDDELFPEEAKFFDNNSIDVLPGLNAYGLVWLPEGGVWDWLKQWGWNDNKFELQGFLGMANTLTMGGGIAGGEESIGGEAHATIQQKFLVLRIGFPKRTPKLLSFVRSMQAGIEFSLEDTLTVGVGSAGESKAGFDLIPKFTWNWDINDDVSIQWSGGFDRNIEADSKEGIAKKVDLVLSGECDCKWESPFGRGDWWIGNPKLELHYNLTTKSELSVAGAFQTGWGDLPSVTAGASLTWKAPLDLPSPLNELHNIAMQTRDDRFDALDKVKMLEADGAPLAELDAARAALRKAQDLDDAAWDAYMKAAKDKGNPDIKPGKFDWKHPEWRIRLSAGNIGFMDLFDLVRSLR
jgi:hypothetical protein